MLNPVLCSYLMEINMENFVYMAITTTVLGLLCIPAMTYIFEAIRSKGNLKVISGHPTIFEFKLFRRILQNETTTGVIFSIYVFYYFNARH